MLQFSKSFLSSIFRLAILRKRKRKAYLGVKAVIKKYDCFFELFFLVAIYVLHLFKLKVNIFQSLMELFHFAIHNSA